MTQPNGDRQLRLGRPESGEQHRRDHGQRGDRHHWQKEVKAPVLWKPKPFAWIGLSFSRIKHVSHGLEFIQSLHATRFHFV